MARVLSFLVLVALAGAVVAESLSATDTPTWGYDDSSTELYGPSFWYKVNPNCAGTAQSPVDVELSDVQYNPGFGPVSFSYSPDRELNIANNGHTTVVSDLLGSEFKDDTITAPGLLERPYRLAQFHFHWGQRDTSGSEHTVDGVGFPAELHLVHYNTKFSSLSAAVASGQSDALAVVGMLFEIGDESPAALSSLVAQLSTVEEPGTSTTVAVPLDLTGFLPSNRDYFTYRGSLTTPNCNQVVRWILLKHRHAISRSDLDALRSTLLETGVNTATRSTDFRPTQPLNGRFVFASYTDTINGASSFVAPALIALLSALVAIAALF